MNRRETSECREGGCNERQRGEWMRMKFPVRARGEKEDEKKETAREKGNRWVEDERIQVAARESRNCNFNEIKFCSFKYS